MALSGNTILEVRTTGADTNGGGFVTGASGTDFSQQDAAQFALTTVTTAAANAICLSASAAATMVGNICQIVSGTNFTAGFYQILSVVAGVSFTLDRTCTSAAGSNGVINIGGAFATPGLAASIMTVNGMSMYVKAGTGYTITSATQNISGGTVKLNAAGAALNLYGYTTTRGDNGKATMTLNAAVASATMIFTACQGQVKNFILDGASQTASIGCNGSSSNTVTVWQNIQCKNFTSNGFGMGNSVNYLINCSATGCTANPIAGGSGPVAFGCEAFGNTTTGFVNLQCFSCMSYNNTGASSDGFSGETATNCNAYGNGRHGFNGVQMATNCHSENNTGWGFLMTGARGYTLLNCTTYNNTLGPVSPFATGPPEQTATALSASAFVSGGTANFSLNSTAGAGAVLRAAGFPGVFQRGLTTGYLDIGAAQHQDTPATNLFIVQD